MSPARGGRNEVFASLFTPSWSLALLLSISFFLPAYRGCNNQTVFLPDVVASSEIEETADIYAIFLLVWPMFFGVLVAVGTIMLAWTREPQYAKYLWSAFGVMILIHAILWIITTYDSANGESELSGDDIRFAAIWSIPRDRITGPFVHNVSVLP